MSGGKKCHRGEVNIMDDEEESKVAKQWGWECLRAMRVCFIQFNQLYIIPIRIKTFSFSPGPRRSGSAICDSFSVFCHFVQTSA